MTIWGNTSKIYLHKIQVQQNRIINVLNKALTFRVKLAPIYNKFSILKLDKVFTLEVSKIMYLAKQNTLPSCLQSLFAQTFEIHTYETRQAKRNSFYVTRFNKSVTKRSISYTGVKTWNNLPEDIQNLVHNSNTTFSKILKLYFLEKQT